MKTLALILFTLTAFQAFATDLQCQGEIFRPGDRSFKTILVDLQGVQNSPEQSFFAGHHALDLSDAKTVLIFQVWDIRAEASGLQLKISSRQAGLPTFRASTVTGIPQNSDIAQLSLEIPGSDLVAALNCQARE